MNKLEIKERIHAWHWSSTEIYTYTACSHYFNIGNRGITKALSYWTRAVRKVKK